MKVGGKALALTLLAIPVALIVAYFAYTEWDMYRVKAMCSELRPGTSISDARKIIARRGLEKFAPDSSSDFNSVLDRESGAWYAPIPALSTMGDMVCGLTHDGKVVLKAEVFGP